jgi:hypothetical protein
LVPPAKSPPRQFGYEGSDTTLVQVNLDTDASAELEVELYGQ